MLEIQQASPRGRRYAGLTANATVYIIAGMVYGDEPAAWPLRPMPCIQASGGPRNDAGHRFLACRWHARVSGLYAFLPDWANRSPPSLWYDKDGNLTEGQNSYFSCSHQASLAFALAKLPKMPKPPTRVVCLLMM